MLIVSLPENSEHRTTSATRPVELSAMCLHGGVGQFERISYILSEHSSKNRSDDGCDAEHRTEYCLVHWSFGEWDDIDHDHDASVHDASSTYASNSPPEDESCRCWSGAAHRGPKLENSDTGQEDPLGRVELIYAAKEEHEPRYCEHVRASVPVEY